MENIKTFTIDLDLPVNERFYKLLVCFNLDDNERLKERFRHMYIFFSKFLPINDFILEKMMKENVETIMYRDEIEFWSNYIGLSFHQVVFLQLIFELFSSSTTIIAELESLQTMIRIVDWPCDLLKDITYNGIFYSKGRPIFNAVCWIGSVGIFTARSAKSKYLISVNHRRLKTASIHTIVNSFMNTVLAQAWPASYLVRHLLETEEKYDNVVKTLEICKLIAPVYFVIGSLKPNITNSPITIHRASEATSTIHLSNLIQTDCDSIASLENTSFSKERMEKVSQALHNEKRTIETVLKHIWCEPVINKKSVYLCIANAKLFETMLT